ncbi:MAG: hypothetical protein JWM33_3650 [Caulobacteraceae bacterium]|nr:hypothetical protein [Caulobacteraceae bacterium]
MITSQLLSVEPVYGRGWRTGYGERMLPPKPFDLPAELDEIAQGGEITYLVRQTNHLLDGLWVCLSRRDEVWNGMCNMVVFRDKPLSMNDPGALFFGYASVDLVRD